MARLSVTLPPVAPLRRLAVALLALFLVAPAMAQVPETGARDDATTDPAAPSLVIELNKLEPTEHGCLVYLVVSNDTDVDFAAYGTDLVFFDRDGTIVSRLAVDMQRLPPARTGLRSFVVSNVPCDSLGRVLLNGLLQCRHDGAEDLDCVAVTELRSRTDVALFK